MTTQKEQVIEAIKNFDIRALDELLDNDITYMNVSKELFITTLNNQFDLARENGCLKFDEVFSGVCQTCNKGCDAITFLSDSGYFLDLYIEGNSEVKDMYVCRNATNFIKLNKQKDLGSFHFTHDEPGSNSEENYAEVKKLYQEFLQDWKALGTVKNLTDIFDLIENKWDDLLNVYHETSDFSITDDIHTDIYWLDQELFYLLELENQASRAIDQLILFHQAKTEREKLIWYFENGDLLGHYTLFFKNPNQTEVSSVIHFGVKNFCTIDITGFEYVLDYFLKLQYLQDYFMAKYEPTEELIGHFTDTFVINDLTDLLELHNVYPDLVEKYRIPDISEFEEDDIVDDDLSSDSEDDFF